MLHEHPDDPLARAYAAAMRDGYRQWLKEHHAGRDPELVYAYEVAKLEVLAELTAGGKATVLVRIESTRPHHSATYPFSFSSLGGKHRLKRKRRKG